MSDDDLKKIIRIEINKFQENLKEIGYTCKYGDDIVDYIFDIIQDEKEYGARPIIRAIQDNIEDKITDALLDGNYDEGYEFKLKFDKEKKCASVK